MLDEVDALLVSQTGNHANQGHICRQQVGLSSQPVHQPMLVAQSLSLQVPLDVCAYTTRTSELSLAEEAGISPIPAGYWCVGTPQLCNCVVCCACLVALP